MKNFQYLYAWLRAGLFILTAILLSGLFNSCKKFNDNPAPTVTTVASGLAAPMGIETDFRGNIWVAETGTAQNDGKVVVITPGYSGNGKKAANTHDAIINLSSIKNALAGEVEGPANLLLDYGMLYILAGDYLYKIDVSHFRPGDNPIDASGIPFEDIGSFVRSLNIVTPNDSHPYDLIKGPDGHIYIVDAGANAIIRRKSAGNYDVFAKFPDFANPTSVGPPQIQSVPTSIIFNGHDFLVTALTGFPFPEGYAMIYKVSLSGAVSVYQNGFTTLTAIANGNRRYGYIALSFGKFSLSLGGFVPNSGSLMIVNGDMSKVITGELNMCAGLKQINDYSWLVSSLGNGTVLKISYK